MVQDYLVLAGISKYLPYKQGEIKMGRERTKSHFFLENWTSTYGWKVLFNTNSMALVILVVEIFTVSYSVIKIKCVGQI